MITDRRTILSAIFGASFAVRSLADAAAVAAAPDSPAALYRRIPGLKLEGDEQIAMLLYPRFTALDLVGPYHFLAGLMGAKVHLVTNQQDLRPVPSDLGMAIQPTTTMADCPKDLTVIFTPGGTSGTLAAARDQATVEFMRDQASRAQYITSVCTGALLLMAAGPARGRRVTTHWGFVEQLRARNEAAEVLERIRYVRDGNVVTAAGVSAGIDMALWLAGQMHGPAAARAVQRAMEYDPAPPYAAEV